MELNIHVNSSFAVGALAGLAAGFAMVHHFGLKAEHVAYYTLCPQGWAKVLGFGASEKSTTQKGKKGASCPFSGNSGDAASCPGAKAIAERQAAEKAASGSSNGAQGSNTADAGAMAVQKLSERQEKNGYASSYSMFWFTEFQTEVFRLELMLKGILFDKTSDFQRLQVVETVQFGKTLVVDGCTQSAQRDEHIYHETLVQPLMLHHKTGAKTVFIGGGGEFATAREVLKHKSVQRCVMVDIDQMACEVAKEHLPEWGNGCHDDPRLQLFHMDAAQWLATNEETFDIIIMDICDPIEAGPGYKLYTQEFYLSLQNKLNPGGLFVTQSGPCAFYNAKEECFTVIHNTLTKSFDAVLPYCVEVPSFGSSWGFNMAFFSQDPQSRKREIVHVSEEEYSQRIEDRILGGSSALKFHDTTAWKGNLGVPLNVRRECQEEDRVMTIDNPVFMYTPE